MVWIARCSQIPHTSVALELLFDAFLLLEDRLEHVVCVDGVSVRQKLAQKTLLLLLYSSSHCTYPRHWPTTLAWSTALVEPHHYMSSYTRMFGTTHPSSSKAVVITGASRGLGYALASCFLAAGDRVLLTSRSAATAEAAAAELAAEHNAQALGAACDVRDWQQVSALANTAVEQLGGIDVWINNAGASQVGKVPVEHTDPESLATILNTNLLGAMLGAKAALSVMRDQPGGGQVWLVDGNGARGNATPGNAVYGASKRALTQLLKSLAAECRGGQCSVHMLSPGMVATDLLFSVRGFVCERE